MDVKQDIHEDQLNRLHVSRSPKDAGTGAIPETASTGAGNKNDNTNGTNNHVGHLQTDLATSKSIPLKPQRKRNKPSLSCETCTVKKTKCDRERPVCFACIKRRSECHYSQLANLIEESHQSSGQHSRRKSKSNEPSAHNSTSTLAERRYGPFPAERASSRSSTGSSPNLLSNIPFSHPTASNLFKAEHPFSNYWTHQGGLAEVIGVLPSKDQADILIARYADAVDGVYPMIEWDYFQRDYDVLWSLQPTERRGVDGSLIALIFVMLAMGTQFVTVDSAEEKEQTAEFYVSASHQALKVINYLGRPSLRSIQTQILITYFLMNDNHASDAWAFAGLITRHAYAIGLNRDPSITVPNAHPLEKQQRRKLWQAVLFQDTFFSIILKLPPTATHSDVRVEDLKFEIDPALTEFGATDISYISSMWKLANIVQPSLCTPLALSLPVSSSPSDRERLLADFRRIYTSFPKPFRTFNEIAICDLARRNKRLARQALFVNSNYHHAVMMIHSDEHERLPVDISGTLQAAHEAINSFFLLHTLFEDEARVWYHFQSRAFSEALIIAEILKNHAHELAMEPIRVRAKDDVFKMIGILQSTSEHNIVARTRVSVLNNYL